MTQPYQMDRRKNQRIPILATFQIFVVIPKKGLHRLAVNNLSEKGMSFEVDIEGEPARIELHPGDTLDIRFYLNLSLYIPLNVKVVRVEEHDSKRTVGVELQNVNSPHFHAFQSFIHMLDNLIDVLEIEDPNFNKS